MKDYNGHMFFGAPGKLFENARELRQRETKAEKILWGAIRNKRLNGLKFRRQHPINKFVADFYCAELQLVIELDGGIHNERLNRNYDEGRTDELDKLGIRVIRFQNEEVINDLDSVLKIILEATE